MTRLLIIATLALITSACAFHTKPFIAYSDKTHPLSDTAVFSVVPQGASSRRPSSGGITHIDGIPTSCFEAGCPMWVRVLPGDHSFTVAYFGEAKVSGMRPRHVYVVHFRTTKPLAVVSVEDLGENPDYGLTLGAEGANRKYYRVGFE